MGPAFDFAQFLCRTESGIEDADLEDNMKEWFALINAAREFHNAVDADGDGAAFSADAPCTFPAAGDADDDQTPFFDLGPMPNGPNAQPPKTARRPTRPQKTQEEAIAAFAALLAANGAWKRAASLLQQTHIHAPSPAVAEELRKVYPQKGDGLPPIPVDAPAWQADEDLLHRALRATSRGRSGGYSGATDLMYRDILAVEGGSAAVKQMLQDGVNGLLPASWYTKLHTVRVTPLSKDHTKLSPTGNTRPVAPPEILKKILHKMVLQSKPPGHQTVEQRIRTEFDCEPGAALDAPAPTPPEGTTLAGRARDLERELRIMGPINPLALEEYDALSERHEFLQQQLEDVKASRKELQRVIRAVDEEIVTVFEQAFTDVAQHFEALFALLFPGGSGRLFLSNPEDLLNTGVEVEARPSGKTPRRLSLLSGGERSLAALAYLFAVFRARPSPFYLLDEVEAALDEVNLHRFLDLVHEFRHEAQLLIVSHQKRTMESADVLYGVTMAPGASSRVASLRTRDLTLEDA